MQLPFAHINGEFSRDSYPLVPITGSSDSHEVSMHSQSAAAKSLKQKNCVSPTQAPQRPDRSHPHTIKEKMQSRCARDYAKEAASRETLSQPHTHHNHWSPLR